MTVERASDPYDEGGDSACWAHLVCPDCGAVTDGGETHRCPEACEGDRSTNT